MKVTKYCIPLGDCTGIRPKTSECTSFNFFVFLVHPFLKETLRYFHFKQSSHLPRCTSSKARRAPSFMRIASPFSLKWPNRLCQRSTMVWPARWFYCACPPDWEISPCTGPSVLPSGPMPHVGYLLCPTTRTSHLRHSHMPCLASPLADRGEHPSHPMRSPNYPW